jgi:hypothetical protein
MVSSGGFQKYPFQARGPCSFFGWSRLRGRAAIMSLATINLEAALLVAQKSGNLDEIIRIATELKGMEAAETAKWREENAERIWIFTQGLNAAKTEADWKIVMEEGYKLFCFDAPVAAGVRSGRKKTTITDAQIIAVFGRNGHKYSRSEIAERLQIKPERVHHILKNFLGKSITKEGELKSTKYFLTP